MNEWDCWWLGVGEDERCREPSWGSRWEGGGRFLLLPLLFLTPMTKGSIMAQTPMGPHKVSQRRSGGPGHSQQ